MKFLSFLLYFYSGFHLFCLSSLPYRNLRGLNCSCEVALRMIMRMRKVQKSIMMLKIVVMIFVRIIYLMTMITIFILLTMIKIIRNNN